MGSAPVKPSEPLAAVVLAAGTGSRMGGLAKPLIRIGGQTIAQRVVHSLQAAGIGRIAVVVAPHTQQVRETLTEALAEPAAGLSFVDVPAGGDQMLSLLQGLRHLDQAQGGVMVCLADQPLIDVQAVAELQAAFVARPPHADMVVPCVNGQPGNPVVLSAPLVQEWLSLDARHIGKAWRDAHPQRVHLWPTHLMSYTVDLDTREDLDALGPTVMADFTAVGY